MPSLTLSPPWLGFLMGAVGIITLITLNIGVLKVAGPTRYILIFADIVAALMLLLICIPWWPILETVMYYLSNSMFLAFTGLLVVFLVKIYQKGEVK